MGQKQSSPQNALQSESVNVAPKTSRKKSKVSLSTQQQENNSPINSSNASEIQAAGAGKDFGGEGSSEEVQFEMDRKEVRKRKIQNRPAPLPSNERERISKLLSYSILDTQKEDSFDELMQLASVICDTPIALISLIREDTQWFKAVKGLDVQETSRESAFCPYAILEPSKVMVVPDASEDPRFANNELVVSGPEIRFYAGAPLVTPDGFAIGTICAIDRKPRNIREDQTKALQAIANQIIAQLEMKNRIKELAIAIIRLQSAEESMLQAKQQAEDASIASLENLLLSEPGREAFREFLAKEHAEENLDFWQHSRTFLRVYDGISPSGESQESKDMTKDAKAICKSYIADDSPKQINIFDAQRENIVRSLQSGDFTNTIFLYAQNEVFRNMQRDSYGRFLKSSEYQDLQVFVQNLGKLRLHQDLFTSLT